MSVTASLKIVLKADDVVVAEVEDPVLWQQVLSAINSPGASDIKSTAPSPSATAHSAPSIGSNSPAPESDDSVSALAAELEIPTAVLVGACTPEADKPYIHFDKHHWEAFRKNVPERGSKAINPVVLAATALALWKEKAHLDPPKMREAAAVLGTIGIESKNPTRSLNNCEWLQLRNGIIIINPAQTSRAIGILRGYCLKQDPWTASPSS